jgi:hypothetical protein
MSVGAIMKSGLPPFPAEHMLQTRLPDWEWELLRLKGLLLLAAVLCLLGLPWLLSRKVPKSNDSPVKYKYRIPWYAGVLGLFSFLLTAVALIIHFSPYNNKHHSRSVFQTPIMTEAECQRVIDMAFATAERNIAKLSARGSDELTETEMQILENPAGWRKLRHKHYPTNDLNLVSDPFTTEDQNWLRQIADMRLAPILSRIYGIPPRSIQANDMFVVRYDAETLRSKLAKHTDGGDISFTIFLNNDFEGGGTQFWNRNTKAPFALLQSDKVGHLSTFPALLEHEGYPTTSGRRMILVGFLNVLRHDEDEKTPSGLSWFASWGNLNWAMLRIKDAYSDYDWTWHRLRLKVFHLIHYFDQWQDRHAIHQLKPSLVTHEQLPEFLNVLDNAFDHDTVSRTSRARWLEGQQKKTLLSLLKGWIADDSGEDDDGYEDESMDEEEL